MQVTLDSKKKELVIRVGLQSPTLSSTGRSYIVATSENFENSGLQLDGRPILVTLKAIVPLKAKGVKS